MKMGRRALILIKSFILIGVIGCIEPFEPEVGTYDSTLVVDGLFSNSISPSIVKLSKSFAYSEDFGEAVKGASVTIEEEGGDKGVLIEVEDGIYETNPDLFIGEIGKSYRLRIQTTEGQEYLSDWELMKASPEIEGLKTEFVERDQNDPDLEPIKGAQILLSTNDPEQSTNFYKWEFEETYAYALRHAAIIRVEFGRNPGRGDDESFFLTNDEYEGVRCWKTEQSSRIIIASTENLTEDRVTDLQLNFIDESTPRLKIRYSILAKQYAISKSYFEFLRRTNESNQNTGSLFDPIPNEVFGNIKNTADDNAPVLGFFSAAGLSESRLFIEKDDIPTTYQSPFGPQCTNDTIGLDYLRLYNILDRTDAVLHNYNYTGLGVIIGFVLTEPPCALCSASEALNKPPDFW